MPFLFAEATEKSVPIWFVSKDDWADFRAGLSEIAARFVAATGFEPAPGRHLLVPGGEGALQAVYFAIEAKGAWADPFLAGKLAGLLPAGVYRFENQPHGSTAAAELAALAWLLSSYRFTRYKPAPAPLPRLRAPEGVDAGRLERIATGITLARDLINTPANDLGPEALEEAALALAKRHRLKPVVIRGEKLLKEKFPLIHAVGKAAAQEPRLVDFSWGPPNAPKVTLVGKGVCFDTGGLDIKPDSAMALMKKDMAGAATALGLAHMIMDAELAVRLRVLLPIVENSISGNAFRPGDVYPSRKGPTVEIGNTDAEGRLILADALALADEEAPDFLFDFATLTGAARVAMGPDLPPFYTGDDEFAAAIAYHGNAVNDPVWRLPLWPPYASLLEGKVGEINNIGGTPFAGSIIAALFLKRFVEQTKFWAHFDIFGWTPSAKPGRPEGGEAQTARLLFDLLEKRFGRPA
jgi:leucyl aminopeptidase